jgi:toxin ParE1/3/4
MKIQWLKSAKSDLDETFNFLLESNPQTALNTYDTIRQKVELLADQPYLGRPGRVENTRELVIARTSYIVAYTVDSRTNAVMILRVLHSRRLWPEAFDGGDEQQ